MFLTFYLCINSILQYIIINHIFSCTQKFNKNFQFKIKLLQQFYFLYNFKINIYINKNVDNKLN